MSVRSQRPVRAPGGTRWTRWLCFTSTTILTQSAKSILHHDPAHATCPCVCLCACSMGVQATKPFLPSLHSSCCPPTPSLSSLCSCVSWRCPHLSGSHANQQWLCVPVGGLALRGLASVGPGRTWQCTEGTGANLPWQARGLSTLPRKGAPYRTVSWALWGLRRVTVKVLCLVLNVLLTIFF
jgi:hypothetical protein